MRKKLSRMVGAILVGLLIAAFGTATAGAGPRRSSGPQVVGTDPAGDWGTYQGLSAGSRLGDVLGQDLIEASIAMGDEDTIDFVIKVSSLPPVGGTPEVTRYLWELSVDKTSKYFLLDGKFTNYSRGACDPIDNDCPPPRDPGMYPFIIKDECRTGLNLDRIHYVFCHEVGLVHAVFDAASSTITIPVPMKLIDAKVGSKIFAGKGLFWIGHGGSVVAGPALWLTWTSMPSDALKITETFVVRKS